VQLVLHGHASIDARQCQQSATFIRQQPNTGQLPVSASASQSERQHGSGISPFLHKAIAQDRINLYF